MKKLIIVVLSFLWYSHISAQIVPENVNKCVAFFFVNHPIYGFVPYGTGFFVGVESKEDSISFGYLVTSKHVFQDENQKYLDSIFVRINRNDGKSDTLKIELFKNGKPIFITHKDQTVDIAVIQFAPDNKIYDYLYIPSEIILTSDIYKSKNIREGDEVFFTGLFTPHFGLTKNLPIVRFGKVALISNEKVKFDNKLMELYLIETTSFGGNSGSPLFFRLGQTRQSNVLSFNVEYFLGGIIQGYFGELTKPGYINAPNQRVWPMENSGIAAVVPANKLHEILFSEELISVRKNILKNMHK